MVLWQGLKVLAKATLIVNNALEIACFFSE